MKVSELEGANLDYWAGKADPRCDGLVSEYIDEKGNEHYIFKIPKEDGSTVAIFIPTLGWRQSPKLKNKYKYAQPYSPSTDWSQGGPIIEQEHIKLKAGTFEKWKADLKPPYYKYSMEGPAALIAAMRAFVASRFGVEVDDC